MITSVGEEVEKLGPGDIRSSLKRFIVKLSRDPGFQLLGIDPRESETQSHTRPRHSAYHLSEWLCTEQCVCDVDYYSAVKGWGDIVPVGFVHLTQT